MVRKAIKIVNHKNFLVTLIYRTIKYDKITREHLRMKKVKSVGKKRTNLNTPVVSYSWDETEGIFKHNL